MKISERIKELRKVHGWKLRDVSSRTGLSVGYLGDIEHGRTDPSLKTCQKICDCYLIELSDLFVNVSCGQK